MGERDAAALDADEDEALGAGLLLDDLVRDAGHRPADVLVRHDAATGHRRGLRRDGDARSRSSFPASRGLTRPHGTGAEIEPSLAPPAPGSSTGSRGRARC